MGSQRLDQESHYTVKREEESNHLAWSASPWIPKPKYEEDDQVAKRHVHLGRMSDGSANPQAGECVC